jgi:hypothetical protein
MSKSHKEVKLPPKWAEDSLSDFIQASFQNVLATFVNKKQAFNLLMEVDGMFKDICGNLDNTENPIVPAFLYRSRSAFLASCRLAMSGQATETFPQLRSCLEYSLYALHINDNPHLTEIWLRRHESKASLKEVKRNFRHVDVMKTLFARDAALHDSLSELYERTIDFGGHPNERAVSSSTTTRQEGEYTVVRNQYLHGGDSSALDHALLTSAQIGLGSLIVFQLIYKERFGILGLHDKIESLKGVL